MSDQEDDRLKNFDSSSDWEKLSSSRSSSSEEEDEEWFVVHHKKPKIKKRGNDDVDVDDDDDDGFYPQEAEEGESPIFMQELLSTIVPVPEFIANDKFSSFLDYAEQNVFPYLPTKTLLRLRNASARWASWISNPFFVHTHSLSSRPLDGFFFHSTAGSPSYVPLSPTTDLELSSPSFSLPADLPEPVVIKSSNHGLLCLLGRGSTYYICNPATSSWAALPPPANSHGADPAMVIVMKEPLTYNFDWDYFLVCAFEVLEGVYGVETFSSEKWEWTKSNEIVAAERIVSPSGVAVRGAAYWRTTMRGVVLYDPVVDAWGEMVFESAGETWEIGEYGGKLSVMSEIEGVWGSVGVWTWESKEGMWEKVGEVEEGSTAWDESDGAVVVPLRGQGQREVAVWDGSMNTVRAMDLERGTERELEVAGIPGYCADFVSFVSSLVIVKRYGSKDLYHCSSTS